VPGCYVDLYWMPVGAGAISRTRQKSLDAWEAVNAFIARRPRAALYHSALKVAIEDTVYAIEVTPVFRDDAEPPAMTGPVGLRGAGRFRIFRYQLRCSPGGRFPDEEYAVGGAARLTTECAPARRVLEAGAAVPPYVWGWRVRGTSEMWTSDSVISWMLVRAGLDASSVQPPPGGRAPGWIAGIEAASRRKATAAASGGR
jgi:hypothetical protein